MIKISNYPNQTEFKNQAHLIETIFTLQIMLNNKTITLSTIKKWKQTNTSTLNRKNLPSSTQDTLLLQNKIYEQFLNLK